MFGIVWLMNTVNFCKGNDCRGLAGGVEFPFSNGKWEGAVTEHLHRIDVGFGRNECDCENYRIFYTFLVFTYFVFENLYLLGIT